MLRDCSGTEENRSSNNKSYNNIKPEAELKTLDEWDSMGVISTIAMLDKKFNKILNAEQIDQLKTVQDIMDLMA